MEQAYHHQKLGLRAEVHDSHPPELRGMHCGACRVIELEEKFHSSSRRVLVEAGIDPDAMPWSVEDVRIDVSMIWETLSDNEGRLDPSWPQPKYELARACKDAEARFRKWVEREAQREAERGAGH